MSGDRDERDLAQSPDDLRPLHELCRDGHLYEIDRWIADGKPLQLAPEANRKGTRPKTALEIALRTGQHSLAFLLLKSGYRLELERYSPLDVVLQSRRWDLFELLLEWGGDLKSVDLYSLLNTYNTELYERFRAAGYDLTERHELGSVLGHGTSNRPLFGFAKRHRIEDPKIQRELNIALGCHARKGNERGVALCLWAGADPHAAAPDPDSRISEDPDPEDGEDRFDGWSAIEGAALAGHLNILKRLGPDPAHDDFDHLYQLARDESIVKFLVTIQPPKHLTPILSSHLWWLGDPFRFGNYRTAETVEAVLNCGVRWEETDPRKLTGIRKSLLGIRDYELKRILSRLARADICAPETYHELLRTPTMQQRLLALGLVKKPMSEREKHQAERKRRADEVERLISRYDRATVYERVWSQPVQEVAKTYGISGVRLGKVCRMLEIPVPPRGYWARVRSGHVARKPSLPQLRKVPAPYVDPTVSEK